MEWRWGRTLVVQTYFLHVGGSGWLNYWYEGVQGTSHGAAKWAKQSAHPDSQQFRREVGYRWVNIGLGSPLQFKYSRFLGVFRGDQRHQHHQKQKRQSPKIEQIKLLQQWKQRVPNSQELPQFKSILAGEKKNGKILSEENSCNNCIKKW